MERTLICDYNNNTFARDPVIARMRDGSLICTALTGDVTEPRNGNYVVMCKSYDDGKTWTSPKKIMDHKTRGVYCAEITNVTGKPMMCVCTYAEENVYRELQLFKSFTEDNGETWSEPVSFECGFNGVIPGVLTVLSDGSWFFPITWMATRKAFDWNDSDESARDWPYYSGCAVSTDKGRTWQRYGNLTHGKGLTEPTAVELENGHIFMLMRSLTIPELFVSESYDYGRTWSEPQKSGIMNPNTKPLLFKIYDNVFFINNYNDEFSWLGRTHLELRRSYDGCKTFEKVLDLAKPEEFFFYPYVYVDYEKKKLFIAIENSIRHELVTLLFDEIGI